MRAVTSGNADKALAYTDGTSDTKSFLQSASTSSKGSYRLVSRKSVGKDWFFLYKLTNDKYKYARTIVTKAGGKWQISSYVYDTQELKLVPSATAPDATESTKTDTKVAENRCLVASDFKTIFDEQFDEVLEAGDDYSQSAYTSNIHFKPDSLEYVDGDSGDTVVPFAHFTKQFPNKDFKLQMYGSIGTDKKADLDFASKRVDKVKQVYLANGGSADKLEILAPQTVNKDLDGSYDKITQETSRVVVFGIIPSKACTGYDNSLITQ